MLAEIFLVRLDMFGRTAASKDGSGRSDTRFVPITAPREKDATAMVGAK